MIQTPVQNTTQNKILGFSLVELSVVLVVIGLLMGGAVSLVSPYVDSYRYTSTQQKMEKIADALSLYAQKNNDLPCPARLSPSTEPFGFPRGSGADGTNMDATCRLSVSNWTVEQGIVPFKLLGLEESQVKDSYGNYISYKITAAYDRYKGVTDRAEAIHRECRTPAWIDPNTGKNKNMAKARFCCPVPAANSTIIMMSRNYFRMLGSPADQTRHNLFRRHGNIVANDVGGADVLANNVDTSSVSEIIAFTLVSHGKNQVGAFSPQGAMRTRPAWLPAYSDDSGNANQDGNGNVNRWMVSKPLNTNPGDDYFDDIVLYRTNRQIMSAFRNNSCQKP